MVCYENTYITGCYGCNLKKIYTFVKNKLILAVRISLIFHAVNVTEIYHLVGVRGAQKSITSSCDCMLVYNTGSCCQTSHSYELLQCLDS